MTFNLFPEKKVTTASYPSLQKSTYSIFPTIINHLPQGDGSVNLGWTVDWSRCVCCNADSDFILHACPVLQDAPHQILRYHRRCTRAGTKFYTPKGRIISEEDHRCDTAQYGGAIPNRSATQCKKYTHTAINPPPNHQLARLTFRPQPNCTQDHLQRPL